MTRQLSGAAILPDDAPIRIARWMLLEVRDETLADQPAPLVAAARQEAVACSPDAQVPFTMQAPAVDARVRLGLRVHIDMAGGGRVAPGDLLSTVAIPVPAFGDAELVAPLTLVGG